MSYAAQTIAAAANVEHEWDARALDWPLDAESVVVEVGGYTGRWSLQIADRYAPLLWVFEPQWWAYEVCVEVLGDRAHVIRAALGTRNCLTTMAKWGTDGCTLIGAGDSPDVRMVEIGEEFRRCNLSRIDLMLMNIEGYEYTLIPHMLARGIFPKRLVVQFHPADANDETPMIAEQLAAHGYRPLWSYGVVLSAWEQER